jgi:16S rRNA (guanine527-N7)-methyltransferase
MTSPVPLSPAIEETLRRLVRLIQRENQKQNLVGTSDTDELWHRHILDSLYCLNSIETSTESELHWIDMGCGAGLPLLPLAITRPHWKFTGIEPRKQRARHLMRAAEELGLTNVSILATTAEVAGEWISHREKFDVVSCRALGSIQEDAQRAERFLKPGGLFVTLKTQESVPSIDGYFPLSYVPYRLLGDSTERHIVFAQKNNEAART